MQEFFKVYELYKKTTTEDEMGGYTESWEKEKDIHGLFDMSGQSSGNDSRAQKPTEDATHIFLCEIDNDLTNEKRIVDGNDVYIITHVDNPLNIDHHMEVYVKHSGDMDGV